MAHRFASPCISQVRPIENGAPSNCPPRSTHAPNTGAPVGFRFHPCHNTASSFVPTTICGVPNGICGEVPGETMLVPDAPQGNVPPIVTCWTRKLCIEAMLLEFSLKATYAPPFPSDA